MSKSVLRIFFSIPVLTGLLAIFSIFGDRSLPQPAQEYFQWYVSQPLDGMHWILNRLALAGLIGIAISTIGLMFFWSPARYVYVVSVLFVFPDQFAALPTLVTGWENILDNLTQIMIGLNIGLMFSQPGGGYFRSQRTANYGNREP